MVQEQVNGSDVLCKEGTIKRSRLLFMMGLPKTDIKMLK